ncbi:hypothetical protein NDI49_24180 [Trichocoleus sp. ST-U3]
MQNVLFATVLFVAYFSFVCCLLGERTSVESSSSAQPQAEEVASSALVEYPWDDQPITMASALGTEVDPAAEVESFTPEKQVQEVQPDISARALDVIDKLGKREARRLCSPLRIQQKCNGVELTTELMVASIRREFKTNPERVIEVICERLPELLSVPQQVDQKKAS